VEVRGGHSIVCVASSVASPRPLVSATVPPARDAQSSLLARFVSRKVPTRILRADLEIRPHQPATDARVTEFYRQYLAVAVFVVAAFVMVGGMLLIARILRPNVPQPEKYITYESGSDPLPLFGQMNVRYYVYALLFVIFDVEAVFIFPWAIRVEAFGWFGLVEIFVFVAVLLLGLAYVWRKGLLKWA
jgi:NADH-quinone oxidoreductase subunit A